MKIRKLLTIVAVFASLALTACGGNTNNGENNDEPEVSECKTHKWGKDKLNEVPATCTTDGSYQQKCTVCGAIQQKTVKALGHDMQNVGEPTATCTEAGVQNRKCSRCDATDTQPVSALGHNWVTDDSKTPIPSTCTTKGTGYQKCSRCPETRTIDLDLADHTYGEWVIDEGKCGEAGTRHRECTECGDKQTETLGIIPHDWDFENKTDIPASNGGVAYFSATCKKCNATGYFVAAADATVTGGKKSTPEGTVKLNADGDSMLVKFYVPANVSGKLYQRGRMDYWYESSNNNQNKTYFSQNSGHTSESEGKGNFKVEVGPAEGTLEEISLLGKSLKYGDMLPEEGAISFGGHQWSVSGDCEIGDCSFSAGLNAIKYTRVDSYNLAVEYFLFVVPAIE